MNNRQFTLNARNCNLFYCKINMEIVKSEEEKRRTVRLKRCSFRFL